MAGCFPESPHWLRVTRGNNQPCAAAACCGLPPFPAADPRSDSSSAPSGVPADVDSARCAADPESRWMPYGIRPMWLESEELAAFRGHRQVDARNRNAEQTRTLSNADREHRLADTEHFHSR